MRSCARLARPIHAPYITQGFSPPSIPTSGETLVNIMGRNFNAGAWIVLTNVAVGSQSPCAVLRASMTMLSCVPGGGNDIGVEVRAMTPRCAQLPR